MITPTTVYLMTRADRLVDVASGGVALAGLVLIGSLLFLMVAHANEDGELIGLVLKSSKIASVMLVLMLAMWAAVPTTKEAAAMIVIPRIANSETVEKLGEGIVCLAREWLEELRPTGGKEAK